MKPKRLLFLVGLLFAASFPGCGAPSESAAPEPFRAPPIAERSLELTEHTVTLTDGSELRYERGILTVPTRRHVPNSTPISLEFFRFFGPEEGAGPPILRMMGGPGWTGAGDRVQRQGWAEFYVLPLIAAADLVIMGQRGFGVSGALECPDPEPLSLEQALSAAARDAARQQAIEACRAQQEAAGVELEGYSVPEMAADTVEVARALGYERIQLLASSFGSHVGMALMRMYPDIVERATFNALEGPDHTFDLRSGQWAAMERIVSTAELKAGRSEQNPLRTFREMVERSREEPIRLELELSGEGWEEIVEPGESRKVTLELGPAELTSLPFLRSTSFSFRWPRWYAALEDVADGRLEGEAEELLWRWVHPRLVGPAELQLDCGSGITAGRRAKLLADPAIDWVGSHDMLDDCAWWGNADLGDGFRSDFRTDIPVLLIHGDHDTSTPISNAVELLPSFTDRHVIWVAGGSHGALVEAFEEPGFDRRLQRWLQAGDRSELPDLLSVASPF
ncbi:hypothetical protein ABI59_13355 [Acidobacteria bacterium Mor1]|nr:hypothetical protein ABI59_13355 [Acidobacteria bacterium Mor1]